MTKGLETDEVKSYSCVITPIHNMFQDNEFTFEELIHDCSLS